MSATIVSIFNTLCLPVVDIEALISGQTIAAIPRQFIRPGQQFALCPDFAFQYLSSNDFFYHTKAIGANSQILSCPDSETIQIKAWATCEICQGKSDEDLEKISQLTIWKTEALQKILSERSSLFLAHLRVYRFLHPIEISIDSNLSDKIGKFVGLPQSFDTTGSVPVLTDRIFAKRRHQLENLAPPLHPELEELQGLIAQLSQTNPRAKELDRDLRTFLDWSVDATPKNQNTDLDWIQKIALVGNSSDGNEFEKLVRRSFIQLGFGNSNPNPKISLDPDATGGAGGLDFYCETPYPVVGECKATKTEKVPDGTPAQLVKLGKKHLQNNYDTCIKIILAAGELTPDAEQTAKGNEMNVIRPETLQRLVELKAQYPGSIDLLKLKPCLENQPFGIDANRKVNDYIDRIESDLKLRSHLVQAVHTTLERTKLDRANIDSIHAGYAMSQPSRSLKLEEMHELLIELSSPLTGYLGREKGKDWKSDRFYFLRDLTV